jgi:rhodanese-related sulfurtransferase
MNHIQRILSSQKTIYIIGGILLGIALTLSMRTIRYTDLVDPHISDIDPKTAYENILQRPKDIVFIDVRSEYEYDLAHASSSVNLPIHYLFDDTHGLRNEKGIPLPKNTDQEIYLMCTGGRLAGVAYSYLEHYGYRNIKRIEGGLKNWNEDGLPIVTKNLFNPTSNGSTSGSNHYSLDRPYEVTKPK